jgi:two-component system, sensor histidine kinase YesM
MKRIVTAVKAVKQYCGDMGFAIKIVVLFIVLSCISLITSIIINERLYENKLREKTEVMAAQNLDTIVNSFRTYVSNMDKLTYVVIYDEELQSLLLTVDDSNYSYMVSDTNSYINKLLIAIKKQSNDIGSLYIFDNKGYKFFRKSELIDMTISDISKASWYQEACDKEGGLVVKINGAGDLARSFTYYTKDDPPDGFLSLIRVINDLQTQQKIGISILNVNYQRIYSYLSDMMNKYGLDICIWDDSGTRLTTFSDYSIGDDILHAAVETGIVSVTGQDGGPGILTALRIDDYNLYVGCITPVEEDPFGTRELATFLLILNIIIVSFGAVLIFSAMIRPINEVLAAMKEAGQNHFVRIGGDYGNDEFGKLKDGYNSMIAEIEELIQSIVSEQELKRKLELHVLMEQVKPHFLYNTFDCISSLAMKNGETEIYSLLSALGEYYKKTLSRGDEIIPLRDELQIVRSYAIIQGYRYHGLFTIDYDVDETLMDVPVLKLILQPILENAIIHGIIPKGVEGTITVGAHAKGAYIELTIADDGVGISRDKLNKLFHSNAQNGKTFGIHSVAERLALTYKETDLLTIDIDRDEGIAVTIRIPYVPLKDKEGSAC